MRLGHGTGARSIAISSSLLLALKQVRVFRPPRSGLVPTKPFLDLDTADFISLLVVTPGKTIGGGCPFPRIRAEQLEAGSRVRGAVRFFS